ncbi:MAG: dTDP-4-dehydrorhamnose 3,5-epimerase [FCB group bacterium]|jgi:dTDP-4-dehydrorhamnose 3,5-epimerase
MGLQIIREELNGLVLLQPKVFSDERGFFMETYKSDDFSKLGLPIEFAQDNHSRSKYGVLRGMHFQFNPPQGKLIRVTLGKAFVAEVDIRHNSPTLGKWIGFELSEENKQILWVPPGFANGFVALSEWVEMQYKCTALWNGAGESNILWNDPEIGIDWHIENPILSEKDRTAQTLKEWLKKEESKRFSL